MIKEGEVLPEGMYMRTKFGYNDKMEGYAK